MTRLEELSHAWKLRLLVGCMRLKRGVRAGMDPLLKLVRRLKAPTI